MTNTPTQSDLSILEEANTSLKTPNTELGAAKIPPKKGLDAESMALLVATVERNKQINAERRAKGLLPPTWGDVKARKERNLREDKLAQQEILRQEREKRSVLPEIPSEADAAALGSIPVDYRQFMVSAMLADIPTFMVPNLDECPMQERLAWQLVPAFLYEYGQQYPHMTPRLLVSAWMTAMTSQTESGQLFVRPDELRLVVHEMASVGKQFNPKMMRDRAMAIRIDVDQRNRKVPAVKYPNHDYKAHRTVSPYEFVATNWSCQCLYPQWFPESRLSDRQIDFANRVIQYRWNTEHTMGFNVPMGRFVMKNLLTAMIYYDRHGQPLSPKHILALAYRFPIEYNRTKL